MTNRPTARAHMFSIAEANGWTVEVAAMSNTHEMLDYRRGPEVIRITWSEPLRGASYVAYGLNGGDLAEIYGPTGLVQARRIMETDAA